MKLRQSNEDTFSMGKIADFHFLPRETDKWCQKCANISDYIGQATNDT